MINFLRRYGYSCRDLILITVRHRYTGYSYGTSGAYIKTRHFHTGYSYGTSGAYIKPKHCTHFKQHPVHT